MTGSDGQRKIARRAAREEVARRRAARRDAAGTPPAAAPRIGAAAPRIAATAPATSPAPAMPAAIRPGTATPAAPIATTVGYGPPPPVHAAQPDPLIPIASWPGRLAVEVASPVVVAVVLAAGLASAVAIPLDRPGIGWPLAGLLIAVGLAALVQRGDIRPRAAGDAYRDTVRDAYRIAAGAAAVALLSVGALRAAAWLFALCVVAALAMAAVAAGDGRTWRGLVFSPFAVALAVFPGLGWVRRGLAALRVTRSGRVAGVGRMLMIAAVTALVLLVFGSLLASADTVFAGILDRMTPDLTPGSLVRGGFLLVAGACLTAGLAWLIASPYRMGADELHWRRVPALDWGLPLAALNALFAIFVWVQLGAMFGWHDYVLAPDGPDYAEYARGGFGQLILVTVLTFVVIAVVAHVASRRREQDRILLRVQIGVLCVLSMVIVASAVNRLWLYQDAYGLTRLRLLGGVGAVWLGVMFLLVMAAGVTLRGGWLARAVVGSAAVTLLTLAVANPDGLIARWNVDRALQGKELAYGRPVDRLDYLGTLSVDAVAAIDRLPEPRRSCLLARVATGLDDPDPWYAANLGRERARTLLAQRPVRVTDCRQPFESP